MHAQPDADGSNLNVCAGDKTFYVEAGQQGMSGALPELLPLLAEISRVYFFRLFRGGREIIDRIKAAAPRYKTCHSADERQQNERQAFNKRE